MLVEHIHTVTYGFLQNKLKPIYIGNAIRGRKRHVR